MRISDELKYSCSMSSHPENIHNFIDGQYVVLNLHRSVIYIYMLPSCPLYAMHTNARPVCAMPAHVYEQHLTCPKI